MFLKRWLTLDIANSGGRQKFMANTYTQLYVHIVFSVKGRQALIPERHKAELHKYITGIITNKKHKLIQINSMPDHIHILVGMTPDAALSGLVKDIESQFDAFYQSQTLDCGTIRVASGIWCVQLFPFSDTRGRRIY